MIIPHRPEVPSAGRRRFLEQTAITLSAAPFVAGAYGLFYGRLNLEATHKQIKLRRLRLQALAEQGLAVKYERVHKVLGEGNFVLVVSEGTFGGRSTSYYDFYRIQDGKDCRTLGHVGANPAARRLEECERQILKNRPTATEAKAGCR